jgi:Zn-dependent peptidase ImmA (M78 family)/transcriptional regulator with XRE-family HTH domain
MTLDQAAMGRRLQQARDNRLMSQEEVADKIGLPRTALVQMEAGRRRINTVELAMLAKIYGLPVGSFFEELDAEADVQDVIHRIAPEFKDDPKVADQVTRHVAICREGYSLRKLLGWTVAVAPPLYDDPAPDSIMAAVRHGTDVAEAERHRLGLGDNPIPDVADLIAAQGIWSSGADLPNEMSGMFLRHPSFGMAILVNFSHARPRKRFSYAHEYAHALLDRKKRSLTVSRVSNRQELAEVRANAFAASFLMPKTGVLAFLAQRNKGLSSRENVAVYDLATEKLGPEALARSRTAPGSQQITCQLVARLAYYFGVSYQAATYRLKALEQINDVQTKELIDRENQGSEFLKLIRFNEDVTIPRQKRSKKAERRLAAEVLDLVIEAYRRESISKGKLVELAGLLGVDQHSVVRVARE